MLVVAGEKAISLSKQTRFKADFFANRLSVVSVIQMEFLIFYFSDLAFIVKQFVIQSQFQEEKMN